MEEENIENLQSNDELTQEINTDFLDPILEEVLDLNLETLSYELIVENINKIQIQTQKSWYALYLLIKTIESRKLFSPEFPTMTAWLNNYCADKRHGLSADRAYTIKRAGKVIDGYLERQEKKYTDLTYLPPQTLTNIDKAVRCEIGIREDLKEERHAQQDKYIEEALEGRLTRDESVRLYKRARYRKKQERRLKETIGKDNLSKHDLGKITRDTRRADALKQAVIKQWDWLGEKDIKRSNFQKRKDNRIRDYYKGIEEFAFPVTGEEHGRRQADVLICENLTSYNPVEATVHAIEIKVDLDDFLRDTKYVDYREYVDYLWLLAPEELLAQINPTDVSKTVGILAYKSNFNLGQLDETLKYPEMDQDYQIPEESEEPDSFEFGKVYMIRQAIENEANFIEGTLRRFAVHLH